jgi:hypothetical protein
MPITEGHSIVHAPNPPGQKGTDASSIQPDPNQTPRATRPRQLHAAITMLYAIFDEALARTNTARPAVGSPDLITSQSREGGRVYSERGYHGSLRTVSLFPVVPRSEADRFGGVYVTPSGAAGPLYLVPMLYGDAVHWWVLRTWQSFTAPDADDLFLAIFEGDTAAGRRLERLYGRDLCVIALH